MPPDLNGPNGCGTGDDLPPAAGLGAPLLTYVSSSGTIGRYQPSPTGPGTWSVFSSSIGNASDCQALTFTRPSNRFADAILLTGPGDGTTGPSSQRLVKWGFAVVTSTSTSTTSPMVEHSAAVVGGQAILAGGEANNGKQVQIVSPGNVVTTAPSVLPAPRSDAQAAVVGNTVYIVGGRSGNNVTPPVLVGKPVG